MLLSTLILTGFFFTLPMLVLTLLASERVAHYVVGVLGVLAASLAIALLAPEVAFIGGFLAVFICVFQLIAAN